jgi:hypothetical protein
MVLVVVADIAVLVLLVWLMAERGGQILVPTRVKRLSRSGKRRHAKSRASDSTAAPGQQRRTRRL